uniref:Tetratricopeptide repeat protein n=1 Tax=Timema douglasi TaxID=61478 RepID=A0A7R8VNK9_TIMDO|nr:unnamed protein product [Timema douglasi]
MGKENRSEEAIRMLERCIRLDPAYTPAYLLLARLYSNRGVHEAVGQLLRHVATLEPESSDHMAEYATWLRDKGRSWEALNYFYKALAFSSTHQISLLGAAKILRSKGQWPRIHQLMIRYHIISRDHKGGVVYTGDLYIRKWRDETMPHNRGGSDSTSSARPSSGSQQNSLSQCEPATLSQTTPRFSGGMLFIVLNASGYMSPHRTGADES